MIRFLLIGMALMLVVGCSSTTLAYRYADWGIVWWVEDYIPMTGEQEAQLEQDIREFRRWHCSNELPRYSGWLSELKADIRAGNFEQSVISHHQDQLASFLPSLAERSKPAVIRLLSTLSDEQVRELAGNMAENQRDKEDEFLSDDPEQTGQDRAERTMERIERWLGPLDVTQKGIVRQWSDARESQTEIWLEGRKNWQQALLEALEQRKDPAFAQSVDELIDNNIELRGPRYQEMMAESRSSMVGLVTDILGQADQQQLDHLLKKATTLRDDFNKLACN